MKKIIFSVLALALALPLIFAGCKKDDGTTTTTAPAGADKTITIGATPTPHAEILEQVKTKLEAQGYTLKIVVYDEYVLPNDALADKTLDANYFQHTPYLNKYNESKGASLTALASIHYEPFGIYGNEITDLKDIADGANIIIPADDSNETRALFLLQQEGLIKLPDDADAEKGVSTLDIVDDGGYNIVTVQADTVPAQLKNNKTGTIAVINGNYALGAGLKITDALASEDASGDAAQTYANIIAIRAEDKDSVKLKALVSALQTEEVKTFIQNEYNGAVVAIF
ncbi:MAG: metal ABC transporter substrate-binding protein [Oscillospiraceae bacterium]|jgi:D-methionine transport system substrate-binding protein|nr:metal ABC transporter substrate-binding protein [Oscillospiraceae bacterium]